MIMMEGCLIGWTLVKTLDTFSNVMSHAKEFGNHSMDFIRTRVVENKGMTVSRKETLPDRFVEAFQAALDIYFPNEAVSTNDENP